MVSFYPMKTIELKARANSPIYGLSSNAKNLPMVTEASRDPELLRHTPESEHDATNLMEEIKEYQSDLKRVKGWRKADLHEQSYRSYVSLSYYLEDVISGRIKNDISISEARNNLSAVRRGIIKHSIHQWVAKRHAEVSREMFKGVDIKAVTNGIHSLMAKLHLHRQRHV